VGLWVRAKLANPLTQQEVDARALVDAGDFFLHADQQLAVDPRPLATAAKERATSPGRRPRRRRRPL